MIAVARQYPKLVVPAYFHPAVHPEDWTSMAERSHQLRLVVLNVADGVGERLDETFLPALARLRDAGVTVVGYVDTDYGNRPIAEGLHELTQYRDWYTVNGVFFDRVATGAKNLDHYGALASSARGLGAATIAFNHGAQPVEEYAQHADLLGTFEGPWHVYVDATVPTWVRARPARQFFHLVYSVPPARISDALVLAYQRNAAGAYVTDHGGANPFHRLARDQRGADDVT